MRNPLRKAGIWLLLALAGASLAWAGAMRREEVGEHWTSLVPLVIGLSVGPIAFVMMIHALFAARGMVLLLSGKGRLASWHVGAAEWDRFRAIDELRSAQHPSLLNELWIRSTTRRDGVAVIVGEKSLLVDGSYHPLSPRALPELLEVQWLEGDPACLEFLLAYPVKRADTLGVRHRTLRVPVAGPARAQAQRVVESYRLRARRSAASAPRGSATTIRLSIAVAVLAAAIAFSGFALNEESGTGPVPLLMAAGGVVVGLAAVLRIIAALFQARRRGRQG